MSMRIVLLALAPIAIQGQRDITLESIRVQRRIALVIGNDRYRQSKLKNPVNDAQAMAETLKRLGFEVMEHRNVSLVEFNRAVQTFTGRVRRGDFALFYFAGHGVQIEQENYLIPVDFAIDTEADVPYKSFSATRIRDRMEASGARLRVLILDACRNNPFRNKRGGQAGLAAMEGSAEGTLIAFATGDNNVADDNVRENNGLFTKHLVTALSTSGLSLDEVFRRTKEQVYRASGKRQNPFTYDNVVGRFYFTGQPEQAPVQTAGSVPSVEPLAESSKRVNPKDGLTYVRIPEGTFLMGCSEGDTKCRDDERPPHPVRISKPFWIGQTEVPNSAFDRFAEETNRRTTEGYLRAQVASHDSFPANESTQFNKRLDQTALDNYLVRKGSPQLRPTGPTAMPGTIAPGWVGACPRKRSGSTPREADPKRKRMGR